MEWKMSDAKNRLGELVTKATTEGPQVIRRHGEAVIVLAEPTYRALMEKQRKSLKEWVLNGPPTDDLELPDRDASPMRDPDL